MTNADLLRRRSSSVIGALWFVILCDLTSTATGAGLALYISKLNPATIFADVEATNIELVDYAVSLLQMIALIACAVLFLRWLSIAYVNAENLATKPPAYSKGWVYWGFFVPFLNLVRPMQVVRDVWDNSALAWQESPDRTVGRVRPPDLVGTWWSWFLATSILGNLAGRVYFRAVTAEEVLHAQGLYLVSNVVDVAAAWIAIRLVRALSDLQTPLLDDRPAGPAI